MLGLVVLYSKALDLPMNLQTSYFFDLSSFSHARLFEGDPQPWLVLPKIEGYLKRLPLGQLKGTISPSAYLIHPELIFIDEGSVVEPGAYIQGPCWIGKNCVVRHGAYIRGNLLTGDQCVIGHDTEVKNAVFFDRAHAAHFAYVGDSILGQEVNLGAGTKLANFKLDHQQIYVRDNQQRLATGLRKFGAIIGDRSQIGCNTVTNPGSLVGKDVRCYPCLSIGGVIPSRSLIKSSAAVVITPY